jgi:2,4-dienoyl-CoA reductase-like NADH-dependent reductase (Old Yellow Enzyme family)
MVERDVVKPESTLFKPLRIGALEVQGRLYKTATGETRATADGFVTDSLLEFYEPMAAGGVPLIITGNCFADPAGRGANFEIGLDTDAHIPGLRRLADMVHRYGSRIFGQVNHCGRQVANHPDPVSASAVSEKTTGAKPRPMTKAEIGATVESFAAATERMQRAGFDGVQLHMAHGYLVSQFLTPYTNRRTDEYGGSFDNRLRFAREILAATREAVGPDFPVIAKLNGHDKLPFRGLDTPELVRMAKVLQDDGLDAIEISVSHYESGMQLLAGRFNEMFRNLPKGMLKEAPALRRRAFSAIHPLLSAYGNRAWRYREGFNGDYARQFTRELSIPVICVGGWAHREAMERAIDGGICDAVSAGRPFIADPLFHRHIEQTGTGAPVCTYCNACVSFAGHLPLECMEPSVRAKRDEVLRTELHWAPGYAEQQGTVS